MAVVGSFVAALVARIAVGDWQYTDAVVAAVVLAVFPFVEWMIHVFILHWRPCSGCGRDDRSAVGPQTPRAPHRPAHHQTDLHSVAVTGRGLCRGLLVAFWAFPRTGLRLTFLVVLFAIGVVYGGATIWSTPTTSRSRPSTGRCTATTGGTTTRTRTTGSPSPLRALPTACSAPTRIPDGAHVTDRQEPSLRGAWTKKAAA